MLIKKEDRKKVQISEEGFIWEYPTGNNKLGVGWAQINGKFPSKGRTVNRECDEIYFVVDGKAKVYIESSEYEIYEGDVLLIEAGKAYYVEGENLTIVASNAPNWYPEQQDYID